MIQLDPRIGSKELYRYFKPFGITVDTSTQLLAGDLAWDGKGPDGEVVRVGVERKRIDDLLQSLHTKGSSGVGRLVGSQLPDMAMIYDYGYVVVEGIWKAGSNGQLMVLGGDKRWYDSGVTTRQVHNFLSGLTLRAGFIVWQTSSPEQTVEWGVDQYRMWEKPWEEHRSHTGVYLGKGAKEEGGELAPARGGRGLRITLETKTVGLVQRVAMQLIGVGQELGERIGEEYNSVEEFVNTDATRLWSVKGMSEDKAYDLLAQLADDEYFIDKLGVRKKRGGVSRGVSRGVSSRKNRR